MTADSTFSTGPPSSAYKDGDRLRSTPALIRVTSQPGFNILKGGDLAGTYTIPQFANCGVVTPLINLPLTGPGNTITLHLGKAHIG